MKNVNVRIPDRLHAQLKRMARQERRSLQQEIISQLRTGAEIYREETKRVKVASKSPVNGTERQVWAAWNALSEDDPAPVKHIARVLNMSTADVAFIVYPAEKFGPWDDSQEPDVPDLPV